MDILLWRHRQATALSALGLVSGYTASRLLAREVRRFKAEVVLNSHFDVFGDDESPTERTDHGLVQ